MTERAPIKRSPHIASLSRDHHHTLLLAWKIRKGIKSGIDLNRISSYAIHFYEQHIRSHFREEETLLFSKLPDSDPLKMQAILEHHALLAMFNRLHNSPLEEAQFHELADLLDKHIRFEERTLFPHIEQVYSVQDLEAIGLELAANETGLPDEWADEFWK